MLRSLKAIASGATSEPRDSSKEEITEEARQALEATGIVEQARPAGRVPYIPESFEDAERRRQEHEDLYGAPGEGCGGWLPEEE